MYVYNTESEEWEKVDAKQTTEGDKMTLAGEVVLKNHIVDGKVRVIVQNGEGYTPPQNGDIPEIASYAMNELRIMMKHIIKTILHAKTMILPLR